MKVITNERLIKRNARIGQIATFGGLISPGRWYDHFIQESSLCIAFLGGIISRFRSIANRDLFREPLGKASST